MPSAKPVYQKLGLKPTHRALRLSVPKSILPVLGPAPEGATFARSATGSFDFILGFYESIKELKADLTKISKCLAPKGMVWVGWRKGNVTDLSRDLIHELVGNYGLEAVSSCAIDDDWSALKLMFPKANRK